MDIPDGVRYRESDYTIPGDNAAITYTSETLGTLGLSICYDLRFPELYRALSKAGAEVLFAPAAFTAFTGAAHWELLLRTRAIENTCYLLAPAQWGVHYGKRESFGHAMLVDAWGTVVADAGGSVIAQDLETSVVWGMPGAAAESGACAAILPLDEIAQTAEQLIEGRRSGGRA